MGTRVHGATPNRLHAAETLGFHALRSKNFGLGSKARVSVRARSGRSLPVRDRSSRSRPRSCPLRGRQKIVHWPNRHPNHRQLPGSWRAVSRPDRGATSVHRQSVQRTSRPTTSAAKKMRMGLSATAIFATNHDCVSSAKTLCIAGSPSAPGDRIFGRGQKAVPNADATAARHWSEMRLGERSPSVRVSPAKLPRQQGLRVPARVRDQPLTPGAGRASGRPAGQSSSQTGLRTLG